MNKNNNTMNVSLSKRIKVPEQIAITLIDDAKRCKRTVPKQIEAILCAYYEENESADVLDAEVIQ